MVDDRDPILDAAIRVVHRYGVRRTTMSDIATEAGVSRQTLYGRYESKDGVVTAAMDYIANQTLNRMRTEWAQSEHLGDRLWVFFQRTTMDFYVIVKAMPDADDLISGADKTAKKAAHQIEIRKVAALIEILAPYEKHFASKGQSAEQLARLVVAACISLKISASSEEDLRGRLETLHALVLAFAGE